MQNLLEKLNTTAPIIMDGGTNSNLRLRKIVDGKSAEEVLFESPESFVQLHKDFIKAGAQIILTATFSASPIRLEHTNLRFLPEEINQKAVELAQQAIQESNQPNTLIAGTIGPCGHMLKPDGTTSPEACLTSYREQAQTLIEAGVDILMIESQFDLKEAQLAVMSIREIDTQIPLICSFSFDQGTKTILGITTRKIAQAFNNMAVDILGINCGKSLQENLENLKSLRPLTEKPIMFKPNAGLPQTTPHWETDFDISPQEMASLAPEWLAAGADLIGGCCGATPDHIQAISQAIKK